MWLCFFHDTVITQYSWAKTCLCWGCWLSNVNETDTPRFHWYPWVRLRGVIDTPESDSAVSSIPLSQTPRCHWYCRVLCDTTETEHLLFVVYDGLVYRKLYKWIVEIYAKSLRLGYKQVLLFFFITFFAP